MCGECGHARNGAGRLLAVLGGVPYDIGAVKSFCKAIKQCKKTNSRRAFVRCVGSQGVKCKCVAQARCCRYSEATVMAASAFGPGGAD